MISKAVEDAYKDFMMQHKFPFVVLHFYVDGEQVDVNVHPTKMELRFQKQQDVYNTVFEGIHRRLLEPELIPQVEAPEPRSVPTDTSEQKDVKESPFLLKPKAKPQEAPQPELRRESQPEPHDEDYFIKKMKERVLSYHNRSSSAEVSDTSGIFRQEQQKERIKNTVRETSTYSEKPDIPLTPPVQEKPISKDAREIQSEKPVQLNFFEEKLLKREVKAEYRLIGQVFDTYWLVQFQEKLYIIDQHAAHERVLYERTLKEMKDREFTSQYLSPPIILTLTMQEEAVLKDHLERFERIGFEIEPFGGEEYAVRAVPDNLFGIAKKELLIEMLDSLADGLTTSMTADLIDEKVASMSCKAAVKGNHRLSAQEVDTLIGELLTLENPYHCPHGRPTIIAMSKRELEKKFKRIV